MTLKKKLFICIICFIILPLIAANIFINSFVTGIISENSYKAIFLTMKQTYQGFLNMEQEVNNLSVEIFAEKSIQSLLKEVENNPDINIEAEKIKIDRWLKERIKYKPYIYGISLIHNNNIILQTGKLVFNENEMFLNKAQEMGGIGLWSCAYSPNNKNTEYVISYYRVINDLDRRNHPLGIEKISVSENALCELYREIHTSGSKKTFLIDNAGTVISSVDKDMIGKTVYNEPYFKKIADNKEGFFTYEINNEKHVVSFYSIESMNWYMINIIPDSVFNPVRNTTNAIILLTIFLCIIFGLLFSIVLSKSVFKPLYNLINEMRKIVKGDFSINLMPKPNDEIGIISNGVINLVNELQQYIKSLYESKIKQQEAQLKAMEAQINPHFLYNTLESIHWLAIKKEDYDVSHQIEALSEMFKHILNAGMSMVTIKEEVNFLESYMVIQKARFGDKIKTFIDVDETLLEYETPKLIIQPIVDNSIKHGLENKLEDGEIYITVKREGSNIRYIITDNGVGTDEQKIREIMQSEDQSHNAFALKNIDDRIKINYGIDYGLYFYSEKGKGTTVEVIIPAVKGEKTNEATYSR